MADAVAQNRAKAHLTRAYLDTTIEQFALGKDRDSQLSH